MCKPEKLKASEELAKIVGVTSEMTRMAEELFGQVQGPREYRVRIVAQVLFVEGVPGYKAVRAANLVADRMGL